MEMEMGNKNEKTTTYFNDFNDVLISFDWHLSEERRILQPNRQILP